MNVQPPSGGGHLQSPKVPVQILNWSKELGVEFGDTLVSDLLRRVFGAYLPSSTATHWQNVQFFEQFRNDLHFQWTLLRSVLIGDNRGKLNAKLLAILCWTASECEEWPQRTLARLIFAARDEKELANLVSLVVAMLPQLCQRRQQSSGEFGLMSAAVLHSLADARRIGDEWNQFVLPNGGDSGLCPHNASRVVENVLTLVRWQQNAPEDSPIRHMGISLPDVRGQLQDALLGWALDYVDDLLQHGLQPLASTREGTSSSPPVHLRVLDTFFSLMRIVVPQVQLPLRFHNKLLTKICALIVAMLRLVDRSRWGTPDDGVDFVCRCFAISGKIFTAQIGASKTHLLAALVDEVFGSYDKLFGTGSDGDGHPSVGGGRDAGARFNFSAFQSLDFLNADKKNENSLFRDLRQMTMEWRSAAEVAHNGTLPRRKRRPLACTQTEQDDANSAAHQNGGYEFCRAESAFVRRLLFLNMVENLCAAAPGAVNGPYDPEMCQFLGQLLVDRFGGDGLTSHFCWLDWDEHERELNPQYLLVSQQLDRCPLVFDLLLLLSDLGFHGLYFCLPLIKAQFVTALAQLECTPLKDCLLSASIRQRCTQIFALLISANFFPGLIEICVEMLAGATNHESAVLMRDLWDFLKLLFSVSLSPSSLHPSDSRSMPPPTPNRTEALNSREGRLLTSTVVLIGQRHIAAMGPLLAKLNDFLGGLDGLCVEDGDDQRLRASMEEGETVEDEWAIERFHQPTAIPAAEIKRG